MAKFNNGLVKEVRQNLAEQNRQRELQEKYSTPENVKVVEKNNFAKFFINIVIRVIKAIATILLCSLAVVGLVSLFHPDIRTILFSFFGETISFILN